jgi:hypothetical protein
MCRLIIDVRILLIQERSHYTNLAWFMNLFIIDWYCIYSILTFTFRVGMHSQTLFLKSNRKSACYWIFSTQASLPIQQKYTAI